MAEGENRIGSFRWSACFLGGLTGGFWLFVLIGESPGNWDNLGTARPADAVILFLLTGCAFSALIAWFSERIVTALGFLSLGAFCLFRRATETRRNGGPVPPHLRGSRAGPRLLLASACRESRRNARAKT